MNDPSTGEKITDPDQIKDAALNFCVDLLQNRAPIPKFAADIDLKNRVHEIRMLDKSEDDICLTEEMFLRSLNDLEIKNKEKYKFIINGGPKLKQLSLNYLMWFGPLKKSLNNGEKQI